MKTNPSRKEGRKHTSNPKFKQKKINTGRHEYLGELSMYAVWSRGRGVAITERSCTETEYIGRGLQKWNHLICCEEEE
jgi:hypothetical protein